MARRRTLWVVFALVSTLAWAPPADACGHCIEDKVAATYDHEVVTAARRNGKAVVFAELRGTVGPASRLDAWIRQQAEATEGVLRGTVRVSLEPAALSFACERDAVSAALRTMERKLAARGLGLRLIEVQPPTGTRTNRKS